MMLPISLLTIAAILGVLITVVLRAKPTAMAHRYFSAFSISITIWLFGIAGWHADILKEPSLRLAFAGASFIPATFLKFAIAYPKSDPMAPTVFVRSLVVVGAALGARSLTTSQ